MKNLCFYNYENFCEHVLEMYEGFCDNPDLDISIFTDKYSARKIIKELIKYKDICSLHIDTPWNNKNDEYIISINDDGLWCEPAKNENGYLYDEPTVCYIFDSCSPAVLNNIDSLFKFNVRVDEMYCVEDEDCEDCDCCCDTSEEHTESDCFSCVDLDDDMHGFSINQNNAHGSHSYSFYSTDKNLVQEMLNLFK